eukprot:Amastigsp_a3305_19.p3 type:complete len:117 gc:universal Amastigsp_a3305_19:676-326(-)
MAGARSTTSTRLTSRRSNGEKSTARASAPLRAATSRARLWGGILSSLAARTGASATRMCTCSICARMCGGESRSAGRRVFAGSRTRRLWSARASLSLAAMTGCATSTISRFSTSSR